MRKQFPILALLLLLCTSSLNAQQLTASDARLRQLVEANVIAVHAFQVLLAKTSGKGDKSCFSPGKLSDAELSALSDHQTSLLKSDPAAIKAWVNGVPSVFDPKKDLEPILKSGITVPEKAPVNVFTNYLRRTPPQGK